MRERSCWNVDCPGLGERLFEARSLTHHGWVLNGRAGQLAGVRVLKSKGNPAGAWRHEPTPYKTRAACWIPLALAGVPRRASRGRRKLAKAVVVPAPPAVYPDPSMWPPFASAPPVPHKSAPLIDTPWGSRGKPRRGG